MIDIRGDRLHLRSMTRAEFHQSRQIYVADPVMDPNPYVYDAGKVDETYDLYSARDAWYPTLGIFTPDGRLIGELSFKRIDREKSRCELGIMLLTDDHKGHGYGTEAFRMAVDYAFDTLGLHAVYADTMGSNVRMQHILHKLGFRCFLRLEEAYDMGNRYEDRLDYVLRREDRPA